MPSDLAILAQAVGLRWVILQGVVGKILSQEIVVTTGAVLPDRFSINRERDEGRPSMNLTVYFVYTDELFYVHLPS